jgi:hypothetical protein
MKTCRLWHNWICGTAKLWTYISINEALLDHLSDHPASTAQQYAKACISRSKGLPLSLFMDNMSIVLYLRSGGQGEQAKMVFRAIARELDKNAEETGNATRLESFMLNCGRPSVDSTVVRWLSTLKNQSIEHVELYNCTARTAQHPVTMFQSAHRVVMVDPRWTSRPNGPMRYPVHDHSPAERLTFQRSGFWHKDDLTHLSIYRNLTDLHLVSRPGKNDNSFMSLSGFFIGPTAPPVRVALPSVERLFLTGDVPAGVLNSLELPALTGIRIHEYRCRHALESLVGTVFCQTIQEIWVEFSSANVGIWVLPLVTVIEQARGLKTLTVTPWMEHAIRDNLHVPYAFTIVHA